MKKWTAIILFLVALCCIPALAFALGVNSENKRRSVAYIPPFPSGVISKDDRMQIAIIYRFIVPPSATNPVLLIEGNDKTYTYLLVSATNPANDYAVHVTGTGNTFENCTFYNANGIAFKTDESCAVTNCIIEGDTQDIDIAITKTVTALNNNLHHSADDSTNIGDGTYTDVGGNSVFASDPLFRAIGSDFYLQSTSPCIDVGFNTGPDNDYGGRRVPQGAGYDIGAFEFGRHAGSMGMGMGLKGYCPHRPED